MRKLELFNLKIKFRIHVWNNHKIQSQLTQFSKNKLLHEQKYKSFVEDDRT